MIATKGYAAPEVEKAYTRARELCQQVGETPQLFPVLCGLRCFILSAGSYRRPVSWESSCCSLAQSVQDPALLLVAHNALGATLYCLGEFASAREHLGAGIALYDPQQHRSMPSLRCSDPGVACLSYAAWTLWYLGYPDQALKRSHEALTLAQELSHPFSLAYAWAVLPGSISSAGRGKEPKSGQRQ